MKNDGQPQGYSYYLSLLTMACYAFWAMSMVAQDRLVSLPSGYVTATIFVYPFVCCILDIITEIYGFKIARKTLWACLGFLYLFALIMFLFVRLPSPAFLTGYEGDFNATMHPVLHNFLIAFVAIVVGQYVNIYVMGRLYFLTRGRYFALRSIASSIVGETVILILAIWGFFVGSLTGHEIFMIIINELFILYGMAILLSFPAAIIVSILKKVEPAYSNGFDFNPFNKKLDS